ncbi:MAG: DUF2778 domain-containing protein [Xanthobacteraceae bacterium]|nr:DUF2778 domain-containing protein [Xanthobacteraceae bacterium]
MPVAPVLGAFAKSDDLTTGSIGRTASAYSVDPAIFAPRLEFAVTATPAVLASISASSDLKLELHAPIPLPLSRPKLAYARPDFDLAPAPTPADARTAVYDIEARTVYLPSGRKLEAHSGLGAWMDDPSSLRLKNRGVTPPNTYQLRLRESLFHGVQAIRLNPVDEDKMFGRDGILAHSYLLGPSGQSNGCVSFSDYPAFLDAFMRGEVDRIVVLVRGGNQLAAQLHGRLLGNYAFAAASPPAVTIRMPASGRNAGATRAASVEPLRHAVW